MNIKNLIMWVIIVLLSVGLFNMFQDPNKINSERNTLPFSNFLNEVDAGRVVEVKIQGNKFFERIWNISNLKQMLILK